MNNTVVISARFPRAIAEQVSAAAKTEYLNEADFVRYAVRKALFEKRVQEIKEKLAKDKDSVKAVRAFRHATSEFFTEEEYMKMVEEETKDIPLKELRLP